MCETKFQYNIQVLSYDLKISATMNYATQRSQLKLTRSTKTGRRLGEHDLEGQAKGLVRAMGVEINLPSNDLSIHVHLKKVCFLSEICLFCTQQKNWYFLSKFFTSVRHLRMFVSNFFQIFPKHFQILKNQKANRVHVHPGAKVNFRIYSTYFDRAFSFNSW